MQAKKPATAHSFNSPASEAVLSLHQLLVKVISAKELPRSSTAQRRNCSVEVTLVGSGGATIEGGMHSRTGPPNHFSTVKDTAPVWNAEFVSEVSAELLSGANLRLDVWDDATSPPVHMGAALLEEDALRELRNRDEERSLPIRPEHAGSAPGGGGGALRLRVALVDVRNALASLPEAEAKATQAQQRVDTAEREQAGVRVGMRLLTGALQEEESHVAVLRQSTPGTHSGVSSQERVDARLVKAKEDAEVVVAAVRDEKKQAMGSLVGMHQQTLAAFKQDLSTQAERHARQHAVAMDELRAELAAEKEVLARERGEAQTAAFESAERVVEQVEANARAEAEALHEQHGLLLSTMQGQLALQRDRERQAMEEEMSARSKVLAGQLAQLKQLHATELSDMKASMAATIEDYEQAMRQASDASRNEVVQAAREAEAHTRALLDELEAARKQENDGEREARARLSALEAEAKERELAHDKELELARSTMAKRGQEQQGALRQLEQRLKERGEEMTALSAEESVELQHEAAGQVGQLNTKHKAETLALQASYNEAVDKLKGEMLGLIEERASTAATAKREYEEALMGAQQEHQAEQARLREQLAAAQRQEGARQEERLALHVSEYEGAVGELRRALLASFVDEQQRTDGALPALQERLDTSVRAHERAAQELLRGLEERLAEQRRLQSGELSGVRDALGVALESTKQEAAASREAIEAQAAAREAALLAQLRLNSEKAAEEADAALQRAGWDTEAAVARSREEREAAIANCNQHWMEVVQRQSDASAQAAAQAEAHAHEKLETERRKVAVLEEAALEQVQGTSEQVRKFEEAVAQARQEALDAAHNRHEQLMRSSLARLTQECGAALEEEKRQHRTQAAQLQRALVAEGEQAAALLEEQQARAVGLLEGQHAELAAELEAARQRGAEEVAAAREEMAAAHARELEEQHAWYEDELRGCEQLRDQALERLATEVERRLDDASHAQRESLEQERQALGTVLERQQAEVSAAATAMQAEATRHAEKSVETLASQATESKARQTEDLEHRARVHQAELLRFEKAERDMQALLQQEREQAAAREAQQRSLLEVAGKGAVAAAWDQAKREHERVLSEAEAHASQLSSQHEAALASSLSQKDAQLGHRLEEYEGQLARLVDEGAEQRRRTHLALEQATGACADARAELQAAQEAAEAALREAVGSLGADKEAQVRAAHERVLRHERAAHALALGALEADAERGMRSTLSGLEAARQEGHARHAAGAAALQQAVGEMHVAREAELGGVAAEQATALGRVRDEYEAQLTRLHKLSEETWAALRAHADQRAEEQATEHAAVVELLEREKAAIKEERTAGWVHLPLPEMLRHAMDEAMAKLHEAHGQQLGALKAEHTAALERAEREVKEVRLQAEAGVAKQQELVAGEVVRAQQQARLDHEQARAVALEELNAQTGAEVQQLRDEQAHILRQRLEEEARRIREAERARITVEQEQLRSLSTELEHDLHFAEAARHAMGINANEAMAAEIERLSAELKAARTKPKAAAGSAKPGRLAAPPRAAGGAQPALTPKATPKPGNTSSRLGAPNRPPDASARRLSGGGRGSGRGA